MKKKGNDNGFQEGRKLKAASARAKERVEDDEDEDEDDRPAKKKKKKKKQGLPMGLLIGGGIGIAVLLIAAVSVSAFYFTRSNNPAKPAVEQIAKNDDKKGGDGGGADNQPVQKLPPPVPVLPGKEERLEDRDRKKGGKSIIGNARGAAYRTERKNELKQIGLFYSQYCDSGIPKSARTKEGFLDSIKRDAKVIHETILDGYYQMNMRADHTSSQSIVAYERDPELNGTHLVVRGDTSVDYVTAQELKAALGK